MKFSLEWLKYFLETEASAADISAALNRIGLEVEGLEDPADKLAGFQVAEVLAARPHPDADKLQVLTVNMGAGEPLQVSSKLLQLIRAEPKREAVIPLQVVAAPDAERELDHLHVHAAGDRGRPQLTERHRAAQKSE